MRFAPARGTLETTKSLAVLPASPAASAPPSVIPAVAGVPTVSPSPAVARPVASRTWTLRPACTARTSAAPVASGAWSLVLLFFFFHLLLGLLASKVEVPNSSCDFWRRYWTAFCSLPLSLGVLVRQDRLELLGELGLVVLEDRSGLLVDRLVFAFEEGSVLFSFFFCFLTHFGEYSWLGASSSSVCVSHDALRYPASTFFLSVGSSCRSPWSGANHLRELRKLPLEPSPHTLGSSVRAPPRGKSSLHCVPLVQELRNCTLRHWLQTQRLHVVQLLSAWPFTLASSFCFTFFQPGLCTPSCTSE